MDIVKYILPGDWLPNRERKNKRGDNGGSGGLHAFRLTLRSGTYNIGLTKTRSWGLTAHTFTVISTMFVTLPIRRLLVFVTSSDTLPCDHPPPSSFNPPVLMEPPQDKLAQEEPGGVATTAADAVEDIPPQAIGKRRKRKRKRKGCSSQPSTSATSDTASAPEDHTASKRAKISHGKSPVHVLLVL